MTLADLIRMLYRIPLREWPQAIYVDDATWWTVRQEMRTWLKSQFASPDMIDHVLHEDFREIPHYLVRGIPIISLAAIADDTGAWLRRLYVLQFETCAA